MKEERLPLKEVSVEEILESQSRVQEEKLEKEKLRLKRLKDLGFPVTSEFTTDDNY